MRHASKQHITSVARRFQQPEHPFDCRSGKLERVCCRQPLPEIARGTKELRDPSSLRCPGSHLHSAESHAQCSRRRPGQPAKGDPDRAGDQALEPEPARALGARRLIRLGASRWETNPLRGAHCAAAFASRITRLRVPVELPASMKVFVKKKARESWARSGERAFRLAGSFACALLPLGWWSLLPAGPDILLLPQAPQSCRRRSSLCSLPVPKQFVRGL